METDAQSPHADTHRDLQDVNRTGFSPKSNLALLANGTVTHKVSVSQDSYGQGLAAKEIHTAIENKKRLQNI